MPDGIVPIELGFLSFSHFFTTDKKTEVSFLYHFLFDKIRNKRYKTHLTYG